MSHSQPQQTFLDDKDEFGLGRDYILAFGLAVNHEYRRQLDSELDQRVREIFMEDQDEFWKKEVPLLAHMGSRRAEMGIFRAIYGVGVSGEGEAKKNSRKGQQKKRQGPLLQNGVPHPDQSAPQLPAHQRSAKPVSYSHILDEIIQVTI